MSICEHRFVRWDNLRMTTEEEARLPGYKDAAIVRRFDAPEAMGIDFYEVRAKSALNLRDLDLFKEIAEVAPFTANLSIPTIDEKVWRQTEPHTPNPYARIEAVAELTRAGIPCGVLIAPLMPGVNDQPEQVDKIVQLCTEAGATSIGGICLHLRGEVRDIWFDWLEAYRPDLIPRYD